MRFFVLSTVFFDVESTKSGLFVLLNQIIIPF